MFQNILKWSFKVILDGVEKELNLHLDSDTPIQAVEEVAMQMISHCAKIKEMQKPKPEENPVEAPKDNEESKVEALPQA